VEFTGVVESIGADSWAIGGKTVAITAETEIKGTIVVGDMVKVDAQVGTDGAFTAKEIQLVEETPPGPDDSEDVEFTGKVESIGSGSWVIDGKTVAITAETKIKGTIVVGDMVKVEALVGTDGALTAKEIKLVEETPPGPDDSEDVEFTGKVESIGSGSWVIDGKTVAITAETKIKGTIVVGDTVKVEALVGTDGALTAREIQLVEDDTPPGPDDSEDLEFTGKVESIGSGSWVIDGKTVAITAETEIKGTIVVGDTVKVEALVGSDGALTAREIQLVEDDTPPGPDDGEKMEFTGVVESIGADSWVIDGKTVAITAETEIKGTIVVGDTVTVHAIRNPDGTLIAREIEIEKEE
jgi:predicted RecA/RadA family phage recombinase